ncbi:hypothetical protein SDC9_175359 [bioreactor metagenome]|uniref:Uncharacterized protein n=1 Tax=bioreactor metagenome TaxID=1076179 RepID=A0A645GMH1_9ZZZZ
MESKEHIHQRGFSRAVFAEQAVDFALLHLKIDLIVCGHGPKALCDSAHIYRKHRVHLVSVSFGTRVPVQTLLEEGEA